MAKPGGADLALRDCGDCPIRRQAVCSRCQADELETLDRMKSYRTYAKGQPIASAGGEVRHVGTLVSGVASISQDLEDGRRQVMGVLLPSDFVGRPGARTAIYDVTAVSEVVMCRFEIAAFERLLESSPTIGPRLLEMTMDELDAARQWMLLLGRKTAREKIATLLHMVAVRSMALEGSGGGGRIEFTLPLTRATIADYLGLTIETVSRQITALRRDGVVGTRGRNMVVVPDPGRLLEETGGDAGDWAPHGRPLPGGPAMAGLFAGN